MTHDLTSSTQVEDNDGRRMLTEVLRLNAALKAAPLPLDLPGAPALRQARRQLIEQLDDYVIPRLMSLDAPVLAVVGGSTGAGKSTLVNTVVGERVTTPGVLRPTTKSPVLVHHPADDRWFGADRLLPDLMRTSVSTDDQQSIQLVATDKVPQGLAILDAPDVDSVDERNRELAGQLLAAADLWLFVTSAARYSDQVPWEYLKQAADRSTSVAVVLDRTPADAVSTVAAHLARMLAARGLKDSPLFTVAEGEVDDDGLLPADHVAEIRRWLDALAADVGARRSVVNQTVAGAVRTVTRKAFPIADAAAAQVGAVGELLSVADRSYDEAQIALIAATRDGSVLRGDLLARWQEFVGSGELIRSLETKVGFIRDRLVNAIKGKPEQSERLGVAIETALAALVVDHCEKAAARAAASWRETEHGDNLLAATPDDLARAGRSLRRQTTQLVREWHDELQSTVRNASGDVRSTTRFLAVGVHGLSVALAVVVLADDAGTKVPDSVVLGRRLLETVLGAPTASSLTAAARDALDRRLVALVGSERGRYLAPAEEWQLKPEAPEALRQAARRVDDLRFAAARARELGGHL